MLKHNLRTVSNDFCVPSVFNMAKGNPAAQVRFARLPAQAHGIIGEMAADKHR